MSSRLRPTEEMLNIFNLRRSLQTFTSSPQKLQVLRTFPHSESRPAALAKTLYILDSSWNPPTLAHFRICTSALLEDRAAQKPKRLLLLLATQNADKAPKPAAFEQRLAMMQVFANEVLEAVANPSEGQKAGALREAEIVVDVGITKEAMFIDKSNALEIHEEYGYPDPEGIRQPMEQVHLTGFDTLIRLLDPKYYPPEHNLKSLKPLFEKHRVRVTRRTDDAWGGREAQDEYVDKIRDGGREDEGAEREWADRIDLVEGRKDGDEVVSSTKVREAAKARDEKALKRLVSEEVAKWIMDEKLYLET